MVALALLLCLAAVFVLRQRNSSQQTVPSLVTESRKTICINQGWRFHLEDMEGRPFIATFDDSTWARVSLPHSLEYYPAELVERAAKPAAQSQKPVAVDPKQAALASDFMTHGRGVGWYRRDIRAPPEWTGKRLFVVFQGAMQVTRVWVNGEDAGRYAVSGYDSFSFDITKFVKPGTNLLAVKVDNLSNVDVPPDGQKTDYIQFGGLCRDVFLVATDPLHVPFAWEGAKAGVRVTTPKVSAQQASVDVETTVRNDGSTGQECTLVTEITGRDGRLVASRRSEQNILAGQLFKFSQSNLVVKTPRLWSPDDPYLYHVESIVVLGSQQVDRVSTPVGLRTFSFDRQQGFVLNGKQTKLIGVNRHQTWPFIGNAVPNGLHRRDAEQIKEMGCNFVRLSHYPQDPDFLDALDELGIMALEEAPTWWDKGNEKWMANLEASFRSMIRRDRNHPCIIVWNTSINHNLAEPRLVKAALEEDPGRPRGKDNVDCMMEFKPDQVTTNGGLTIEYGGHTFPTSRGDRDLSKAPRQVLWELAQTSVNKEYDLARLDWEKVDLAYRHPDNAGVAVWCMYDYNTFHNSLNGIARHGVYDLFRLPKYSAWWYRSELTTNAMAYVLRVDATNACVFSNCEQVRLLQDTGGGFQTVATQKPDAGFVLHHPPFHFAVSPDTVALKAEGLVGTTVAATNVWRNPGEPVAIRLEADRPEIAADGSDISRVIARAVDANGTVVDDCNLPVSFTLEGPGKLIGENPATLRAGEMIILVQSTDEAGALTIRAKGDKLKTGKASIATVAWKEEPTLGGDDSERRPL